MIYLVGSLQNPQIPGVAKALRVSLGVEIFDDWYSPGPETDVFWRAHEKARGRTFKQALQGHHAQDVFAFDKRNLERADAVVLVLPAGKSGHLELGWAIGKGKPSFILLSGEPERFDLMYAFADYIAEDFDDLVGGLRCRLSLSDSATAPVTARTPLDNQWSNTWVESLDYTLSQLR